MRNDDIQTELAPLPANAQTLVTVSDSMGSEWDVEIHSITYNAHTNTIHIQGS
jgi:hypothetical protein